MSGNFSGAYKIFKLPSLALNRENTCFVFCVCRSVFLTECRINKKRTPSYCFFGNSAHWAWNVLSYATKIV